METVFQPSIESRVVYFTSASVKSSPRCRGAYNHPAPQPPLPTHTQVRNPDIIPPNPALFHPQSAIPRVQW